MIMRFSVSKEIKLSSIVSWVYVLFAFYSLNPYFTWRTFYGGVLGYIGFIPVRSIFALFAIVLSLVYLKNIKRYNKKMQSSCIYFLIVCTFLLVVCGLKNNSPFDSVWISFVACAIFILLPLRIQVKTLNYFMSLYVVTLIPGLIMYLLESLMNISFPYDILKASDSIKSDAGVFYKSRFLYSQITSPATIFPRFNGIYYEAGVVGTVSGILLGAYNYEIQGRNKWREKIIFFSGICSLTLSFFIFAIIYFCVNNITKGKIRNVIAIFMFVLVYFIFVNVPLPSPALSTLQSRMTIVDFALNGDNRTNNAYDQAFETLYDKGAASLLFGEGRDSFQRELKSYLYADGSSYKNIIYDYGFLGFILYVSWYFYVTIQVACKFGMHWKCLLPLLLMQIANIYQRPDIFAFYFFLIFIGGLSRKVLFDSYESK